MIKEIKGYTNLEQHEDSFIVRIPDNIIDLLVLDNNQRFLISVQGESIVLTPEVKQLNTIGTAPKKLDKILSYFCLVF